MSKCHAALDAFLVGLIVLIFSLASPTVLQSPTVGVALPQGSAVFETSLQSRISASDTSMTLVSNALRGGETLSGYNCFTIDEAAQTANSCVVPSPETTSPASNEALASRPALRRSQCSNLRCRRKRQDHRLPAHSANAPSAQWQRYNCEHPQIHIAPDLLRCRHDKALTRFVWVYLLSAPVRSIFLTCRVREMGDACAHTKRPFSSDFACRYLRRQWGTVRNDWT